MKKLFFACLVSVCVLATLSLAVSALPAGLLESTTEVTEATGGFFSALLHTVRSFYSTITNASAGHPFWAVWSAIPLALLMLFIASTGYRFFRPLSIVCGGALGFVIGFSICHMFSHVDWLASAASVLNWVFGILLAAGGVAIAIYLRRFGMALFLSISLCVWMSAYTDHSTFLTLVFILSLVLFIFATKALFIPLTAISGTYLCVYLLFGPNAIWSLAWLDATLGFTGNIQMWVILFVAGSIGCMTLQSRISRGAKYY